MDAVVTDPLDLVRQLTGSDQKRLRAYNTSVGSRSQPVWASLVAHAGDTYATWKLLTHANTPAL